MSQLNVIVTADPEVLEAIRGLRDALDRNTTSSEGGNREAEVAFVMGFLAAEDGPVRPKRVKEAAVACGFSERSIERAVGESAKILATGETTSARWSLAPATAVAEGSRHGNGESAAPL